MPLIRFISPVDSMWRSTVKVIEARLVEDTLIRRYEAERTHVAGGEVAHCVLILVHRIPLARVGSWKSLNYCLRNSGDTRIILGSTRKLVQAGNISVTSHGHAAPRADQYRTYGLNDSSSGLTARIVEKSRAWSACGGGDIESRFSQDELLTHKKRAMTNVGLSVAPTVSTSDFQNATHDSRVPLCGRFRV